MAAIVRVALRSRNVHLARFLAVARHYMLRVQSELAHLQTDGRQGVPATSLEWHSRVQVTAEAVTIVLRKRKNEPHGAAIARSCVCRAQGPLLCGTCALKAQVTEARARGLHAGAAIFPVSLQKAMQLIRSWAAAAGVEAPTWHAFRRGMASDMLAQGSSVAQILVAGGWRSSAFLRYLVRTDVDLEAACSFALNASDSEAE